MDDKKGLTILDVLQLIFIVLKLVGVVDGSWWLVLSPILSSIFIYIAVLIYFKIYYKKHTK